MTYRLTLQGVAILLLTMFSLPALAWWHCDWNYRFPIGISQPPGPAVTDYQVRVNLNAANVPAQFNWSLKQAQTGGFGGRVFHALQRSDTVAGYRP
jgi:hypothetical protein